MSNYKEIKFFQKTLICLIVGLLGAVSVQRLGDKFSPKWLIPQILIGAEMLFFLCSIASIFIWHSQEKKREINSQNIKYLAQDVIAYLVAFNLIWFGYLKLLHLHMNTSLVYMDTPTSNLKGYDLMDVFFNREYAVVIVIGCLQIIGSLFLLFKKTRMLGSFTLIPILVNIIVFNIAYDVGVGVTIQASMFTIGLFYLILQEYDKVVAFFFQTKNSLSTNNLFKNIIRVAVVGFPLIYLVPNYSPTKHPSLIGKYEVEKMTVNGNNIDVTSCKDTVLTLVYFDLNNDIVFCYGSINKRRVGAVHFDETTRQLQIAWRYPKNFHDTLFATLSNFDNANKMTLSGIMGKDKLLMTLLKRNNMLSKLINH